MSLLGHSILEISILGHSFPDPVFHVLGQSFPDPVFGVLGQGLLGYQCPTPGTQNTKGTCIAFTDVEGTSVL